MNNRQRESPAATEIDPGSISIEWLESNADSCVVCDGEVGFGPVGFYRASGDTNATGTPDTPRSPSRRDLDGALCDQCLLDHHLHLGMLIVFVNAGRELVEDLQKNPLEADRQRLALMTFASIYDLSARWPRRSVVVFDFLRDLIAKLLKQVAHVPRDVLGKLLDAPGN